MFGKRVSWQRSKIRVTVVLDAGRKDKYWDTEEGFGTRCGECET